MLPPSTVNPVLFISPADVDRGATDKHTLLELLHEVVHNLLQLALLHSKLLLEVLDRPQKVLGQLVRRPCTTWLIQLKCGRDKEPHPCGTVVA
jgi:hypothetical protein